MGSMVMGHVRGGIDIRTMGSGNAGGTNALRTQGVLFALGVIVVDIGKGALATAIVPSLNIPLVGLDPEVSRVWLTMSCDDLRLPQVTRSGKSHPSRGRLQTGHSRRNKADRFTVDLSGQAAFGAR